MAASPQFPPPSPRGDRSPQPPTFKGKQFPWGLVAGIIVIICLGLIAYYFFR